MYANFAKARYWVNLASLNSYVRWAAGEALRGGRPVRDVARALWISAVKSGLPVNINAYGSRAEKLGVRPGWIRYPTDSTRVQVFSSAGDRVCKLSKAGDPSTGVQRELASRAPNNTLAPRIFEAASDGSGFTEEYISGASVPYSIAALRDVLRSLKENYYQLEEISLDECLLRLRQCSLTSLEDAAATQALAAWQLPTVPITRVHGDLVWQNLRYDSRGLIRLLDWEYSRTCIATYDCWLYLYHRYSSSSEVTPTWFLPEFSKMVEEASLYRGSMSAESFHMLHLVERNSFLRAHSAAGSALVRQTMEREMEHFLHQAGSVPAK